MSDEMGIPYPGGHESGVEQCHSIAVAVSQESRKTITNIRAEFRVYIRECKKVDRKWGLKTQTLSGKIGMDLEEC